MFRLVARYGDDLRRLTLLDQREVTVGSAEGNAFVVPFPGVSRRHARIVRTAEGVKVVDLDSKNGLITGGERRRVVELRAGECLGLGRAVLSLEEVAAADLEIAMVLDRETDPSPPARGRLAAETAPHWAFHVVRELDDPSSTLDETRRAGILARSARAVGADGLWTFAVVEGDLFLRDFVGAVPSAEAIAEVTGSVLGGEDRDDSVGPPAPIELQGPRGPILACPPPDGEGLLLVAAFPPDHGPAPWVPDLLVHLAEGLRRAEAGPRCDDVPALVRHFALQASHRYGKRVRGVGRKALELLQATRWEGRLRELEHTVEGAVLRCPDGEALEVAHLAGLDETPPAPGEPHAAAEPNPDETLALGSFAPLAARLEAAERQALSDALERARGDVAAAAGLLGINPRALAAKLARFGLDGPGPG